MNSLDNNTDLNTALSELKKYASKGYQIASKEADYLNKSLYEAQQEIRNAQYRLQNSPVFISSATDSLTKQLIAISKSFDNVALLIDRDLRVRRKTTSDFSVTLFGRTMAGKSTLMEILTEGDGKSIGCGGQRTTQDIRSYPWNGLTITDVPGIDAFEGGEDEIKAFDEAKKADLILFLITDDRPEIGEAAFFGKLMSLGKPMLCLINVKTDIDVNCDMDLAMYDIQKKMKFHHIDKIKQAFLQYSKEFEQDWNNIKFVSVHLKCAYISQKIADEKLSKELYQVSNIQRLKNDLVKVIKENGRFYRIKTFVDAVSIPMVDAQELLINQSTDNSFQGRIVLDKKRQLEKWKDSFSSENKKRVTALMTQIKGEMYSAIAEFAEEHYDDKNVDKAWQQLLEDHQLLKRCQDLSDSFCEECDSVVLEFSRQIFTELSIITMSKQLGEVKTKRIIDSKGYLEKITDISSGLLLISAEIFRMVGSSLSTQLGFMGVALAAVKIAISVIIKSKEVRIAEARKRLEYSLNTRLDEICNDCQRQLLTNNDKLATKCVEPIIQELTKIDRAIFSLADIQKRLSWRINRSYLDLNKKLVFEALTIVGSSDLHEIIEKVSRIPGNTIMIMIKDQTKFPEDSRDQLKKNLNEIVRFVYPADDKRILISRVLGKTVERNKINIEDRIGVAHVRADKQKNRKLVTNIRLAQQLSELVIIID